MLVNAGGDIWLERDGRLEPAGHLPAADLAVVVERILAPLGRRLDRTSPVVDARLPDGSRVCAVIPPVAADGACLSVRRFRDRSLPFEAFGSDAVGAVLDVALAGRCNVIVSGVDVVGQDLAAQLHPRPHAAQRAHRHHRGHRRAAPGRPTTSCGWRPARRHPTARSPSRSTSSCARRCACARTASSSARCAARKRWRANLTDDFRGRTDPLAGARLVVIRLQRLR